MPLSAEQVYNDLNGSDVKQILLTRFADLINQVGEFQPHLTLPRTRMILSIHLDVWGRTPPTIDITDDLIIRMRDQNQLSLPGIEQTAHDLQAEINSDTTTPTGQPPDQIREEHGLPIMTPQKGPFGIEDVPVVREDRMKYAAFVTQDYGPARSRTGQESPVVGGDVIAVKNGGGGRTDVSPDFSRVSNLGYQDKYDSLDINGQKG